MLIALESLQTEYAFTIEVIDVDGDERLVQRFDELVPVLCGTKRGGESMQLCHYFLDEIKVRSFLSAA